MKEKIKAYLGNNPYIFVSYAHKSKADVRPFIAALQQHYNVWFDEGIRYGKEWTKEIVSKLNGCTIFIYLITEESLNSANCQDEIHSAREAKKVFLNVLVKDGITLPEDFSFRYGRFQMCNLFTFSSCAEAVADLASKCEEFQKVIKQDEPEQSTPSANTQDYIRFDDPFPLLKRAFLFLEDGDWAKADDYCEKVLDRDPENAEAYLCKLMAELHVCRQEDLANCEQPFDNSNNYQKALRFGDEELKIELKGYIANITARNEDNRRASIYNHAVADMNIANTDTDYKSIASAFKTISGFKDADSLAEQCLNKAEVYRKDAIYATAKSHMIGEQINSYETAIKEFSTIPNWKDSNKQIDICLQKIEQIKEKGEAEKLERARKKDEQRIAIEKAVKKRKRIIAVVTPIFVTCIAFLIVLITVIIPNNKYNTALRLYNEGKQAEAITIFTSLNNYKDSAKYTCFKIEELKNGYCVTGFTGSDTELIIPNGVTSIGNKAFENCVGLKSISIPNSVADIGYRAFLGCTGLTSVIIPESVTSIGGAAFEQCTGLTSIVIPNGVTSIKYQTFRDCIGLTNISIPNSVTAIEYKAFSGCAGLRSITLPDNITRVGEGVFENCSGLTNIIIPESVTSIAYRAFFGCTGLTSITIPSNVTNIAEGAFSDCSGLVSMTVSKNNPSYHSSGNCIIETASKTIVVGCKSSVIPKDGSATSIGDFAFSNCASLTSIIIPDNITSIGYEAFGLCTSLRSIVIPASVTNVGNGAFYKCTSLTSVEILGSITNIGDLTFDNCWSLVSVTIPNNVTSIGNYVFLGCMALTNIIFQGTKAQWSTIAKGSDWDKGVDFYTIHCTDGDIAKE